MNDMHDMQEEEIKKNTPKVSVEIFIELQV